MGKNHFRRPVPACCYVVSQLSARGDEWGDDGAGKPKIANFKVTVAVDEQIARLKVSMQDSTRVEILESAKYLI